MQQLRKVLTQTTWANASDAINKNSDRIYEAITRVENATTKNKGYFETSNALLDTYPNPSVGDIAFVFNSANTTDTPYDVYKAAFSSTTNMYEWYDSGINASFADVDINSVKDSIRDIEQQVDTLKDPRLPIICDANGRIGLNVGNGLYVDSNGDLCATQSIGGGGGSGSGGESYYAAAGISINEDNFISVKVGASLDFDNNNALKVGTGEGLVHNRNGKLSVNVGKGLVIDNKTNAIELEDYDAIKEIPIAIQKKQDKLIEGSGIEITSENVINVDGSTMHVQLSTNAINDEDGKRIKTTYAKKEEIDGIYGAIEATNTTVASHTTSIENLTNNKQDKLDFGNGLSTVGNLVKVADAVLKDIADNKKNIGTLSSSISGKQDKLTPSDGINLDDGKLSVHIGTGLEFDPLSSAVVVKMGAGVKTDINQSLTIKHDATLTTDAQGQLGVNQGTITNIAASEVAKVVANAPANYDTLKEIADYIATDAEGAAQLSNRIGALESALPNKMNTIAFGSGLAFSSNVVTVDNAVMNDIGNNKSNISKLQSSVESLSTNKQNTISDLATIRNNAANGATAYGWGSHRTAGYAKKVKVGNTTYEADADAVVSLPAYPTSLPANGGNADTLGGYLPRNVDIFFTQAREKELDLTALDSNYYYPCSIYLTHVSPTQIRIWCSLGDRPIPSWATHRDGFVLNLEWEAVGCGWGITSVQRKITTYHYVYSDKSPCGDITQSTSPSEEIVFLRGGAKYFYHTSNGRYFVVHPNGYSWSLGDWSVNHPIRPLSEAVDLWSCSDNSALGIGAIVTNYVYGTAARADKLSTPRTIWGQSFDGSGDIGINDVALMPVVMFKSAFSDAQVGYVGRGSGGHNGLQLMAYGGESITVGNNSTARLHITPDGNVGIGTTDPKTTLDVKGEMRATTYFFRNNPNIYLDSTTENALIFYDGESRRRVLHTGNIGDGFEQVGNTIKISTSYIAESLKGDGLVLGENGKLNVDSSKVVTVSGRQSIEGKDFTSTITVVSGNDAKLAFNNTDNENKCQFISFQQNGVEYGTLGTLGDGDLRWRSSKVLHEHNIAGYAANLSVKNADTLDGHDSSYFATKTELGNKQNTLAFGSGIAHSNNTIWVDGSQLNVNFANSAGSVAWGNVSGRPSFGNGFDSTNNVVQLKLSTGLAIDDRGYLYVTGL